MIQQNYQIQKNYKKIEKKCNRPYGTPSAMPRPLHVPVTPPWLALGMNLFLPLKDSINLIDWIDFKDCDIFIVLLIMNIFRL